MHTSRNQEPSPKNKEDADKLADFVLFTQRNVFLNLGIEFNKGNVSFPQFFLLNFLANEEYLTMGDITKKMGHGSASAATGLVSRLEKLDLVERMYSSVDKRKIMVIITVKGRELIAKMRGKIIQEMVGIIKDDKEDIELLDAVREIVGTRFSAQ